MGEARRSRPLSKFKISNLFLHTFFVLDLFINYHERESLTHHSNYMVHN